MKVFADSSALVKRYVEEEGSERIDRVLGAASALGVSVLCSPDIISTLNRRRREGDFPPRAYESTKATLLEDLKDADVVHLTPEVLRRATRILESHPLRAMDALHVACALAWGAERFVSADRSQLRAASRSGLKTLAI